ncbi:CIS tube protein [Streptomyces chartreusis]|uniref:CIS tube protein n=1 Tax=Streptomyces chartreusis TaxID=1969 RepID=UPI00382EFFCC
MTAPLAKATLQEVGTRPPAKPRKPVTVQFNPTSLRLQMANNVDMKKAFGKRPVVQYDGTSSSTLSFDLIYDTSDVGTTQKPVDVRMHTKEVERFLLPAKGTKSVPPLVRFCYGTFQLVGVMSALNEDYDLFSANGVPLRAKLAVTIKEQLPEYEAGRVGPASNTGAGARDGQGLLSPGGVTPSGQDRTGSVVAGESAPEFAGRMGLDPASWKDLDLGGQDPLSLSAGATVDFSASLSAGPGLAAGITAGVTVGTTAGDPSAGRREPDPRAVTSAGGLQNTLTRQAAVRAAAAADAQRAGFGAPEAARTQAAVPREADRRELTFGTGVPLKSQVRPSATGSGDVPVTADPTVPPWLALGVPRATAKRPARGCACHAGGCRCIGGPT